MATQNISYGTWASMTVTNLASLANDTTDPFTAWQSARVDNRTSVLADDYEIVMHIPMAATAPANDKAAYVYLVPWLYDGSAWIAGSNFGTTTLPTGSEGTASVSVPSSMRGPLALPYKVTSQTLSGFAHVTDFIEKTPDGWSLAIRNASGAAFGSSGITIGYRPIFYTIT